MAHDDETRTQSLAMDQARFRYSNERMRRASAPTVTASRSWCSAWRSTTGCAHIRAGFCLWPGTKTPSQGRSGSLKPRTATRSSRRSTPQEQEQRVSSPDATTAAAARYSSAQVRTFAVHVLVVVVFKAFPWPALARARVFLSWGPTEGNIMRNRLRRVLERLRAAAGLDRVGARLGGIRAGQRAQ
jgi:hypothetical protein